MGTRREWFLDPWYKSVHYLFQSKSVGAVKMKNWSTLCRINVNWHCTNPKASLTYKMKESFDAHFTLPKVSDKQALPRRLTELKHMQSLLWSQLSSREKQPAVAPRVFDICTRAVQMLAFLQILWLHLLIYTILTVPSSHRRLSWKFCNALDSAPG